MLICSGYTECDGEFFQEWCGFCKAEHPTRFFALRRSATNTRKIRKLVAYCNRCAGERIYVGMNIDFAMFTEEISKDDYYSLKVILA